MIASVVYIVVDTNTGRYYDSFLEYSIAMDSIKISYSRSGKKIETLHQDNWNTDLAIGNDRLTIKTVTPKLFAEHL